KDQQGFSLVEVILASAVFVLLVTALVGAYLYGQQATVLAGNRAQAVILAQEGLEAVRNIRDFAFSDLADGTYGLSTVGNAWSFSGSQDISTIFTREIIISSIDAQRRSVTANVAWQQNPQRNGLVSLTTRLTDWTVSGLGDWANPIEEASINIPGLNNGRKIQVQGNYAYLVRLGGSPNFQIINVTDPANPVAAGFLTLPGTPTNIAVSGNFAYVSSTNDSQELQIIDISNASVPFVAGTYNAPGLADANGVHVNGTTVYLVRVASAANEFQIVNAATPSLPVPVGSVNLGPTGNEVIVSGNFAYVASSADGQELQVINITTPSLPTFAGFLNLPGTANAITIALTGATVLLGQANALYTIDVSTPATPFMLGSTDTFGILNDIALNLANFDTYVYVATSADIDEFQVINISDLSLPVFFGSVDVATNSNMLGVAYDDTLNRAFGAGASNIEEFLVFAPQ
ncbi:MAG: prepilin-type N-terminal cleavage/methylation domain-containing protein, partial [Patescibacteria group bacterium]